jgi:diadenosine tetraphosphate (Ap4A) HIT family hydrolase
VSGSIIDKRVALARRGKNPFVVAQMPSGWLVMTDKQVVPGQLILLADPVVPSLNALTPGARAQFLSDMALAGDILLAVTGCQRVNYEILGNSDPALHVHIIPRYADEPEGRRKMPIWFYDWQAADDYSEVRHGALRAELAMALNASASRD